MENANSKRSLAQVEERLCDIEGCDRPATHCEVVGGTIKLHLCDICTVDMYVGQQTFGPTEFKGGSDE